MSSVSSDGAGNGTLLLLNGTLADDSSAFVFEFPSIDVANVRTTPMPVTYSKPWRPAQYMRVQGKRVKYPYASNPDVIHILTKGRNRLMASASGNVDGSKVVVLGGLSCGLYTIRAAIEGSNSDALYNVQDNDFTEAVRFVSCGG